MSLRYIVAKLVNRKPSS